jgi:hypothetical protein
MAKKNISSDDFLNLLADQETSEVMAFQPKKVKPSSGGVAEDKLGPVQRELLEFALDSAPTFVSKWVNRLRGINKS